MIKKLKSNSGETITEVLVAALVVVLGVLLYTMMVQSSFRIITRSEDAMTKMYAAESNIEAGSGTGTSANVTFSITGIASPNDLADATVTVYGDDIKAYTYNKSVNP